MKKLVLSLLAVTGLACSASAQTEKGKFVLGGSFSFTSTKVDGAIKPDVSFDAVPSIGYFAANNFAIGTGVGYTYSKEVSEENQNEAFVVAPFGRYYVNLSDQFKFFGQLSVPLAFGSNKDVEKTGETGNKNATTTSIGVNLAPGFVFFPTKSIGIEVSVNGFGYQKFEAKSTLTDQKAKTTDFGFDADTFAPRLGISFHF